jgi:nicotinamidase-related amidase
MTAPELWSSALVTIDVQTDTLDGQPLEIAGTSAALPNMRRLAEAFRAAERPIVHVVRLYLADGSNAEPSRQALASGPTPVLRPGTPGRLLAPDLLPPGAPPLDDELLLAGGFQPIGPNEVAMFKPRWGAFYRTSLEEHLRGLGVSTLVFAGCNFPNCPRTSIYEASERDFRIVLADDATSGVYDRGRTELTNIGVTCVGTDAVLGALSGGSG